jgi:outer membrane lipoprotein-sorting protein
MSSTHTKKTVFLFLAATMLVVVPFSVFALTADEIVERMDENNLFETSYTEGSIQTTDRFGLKTSTFKAWSKGSDNSLIEFTSTAERGQKVLRTQDSLYLFYPDAEEIIRLQGSALRQSLLGSDLSYEDMTENNDTLEQYTATLEGTESYEGRPCYVISLAAKTRSVAYPSQKLWVDTETFLVWKGEYATNSGRLLKEMKTLETTEIGGKTYPTKSRIEDKLKKDSQTVMGIDTLQVDIPLDDDLFSLENLTW